MLMVYRDEICGAEECKDKKPQKKKPSQMNKTELIEAIKRGEEKLGGTELREHFNIDKLEDATKEELLAYLKNLIANVKG